MIEGDGLHLQGKLTREGDSLIDSVFSSGFSNAPRAKMYQSWVFPGLHPDEPQPVISNWSDEDRELFCGGNFTISSKENA